MTNLPEGAWDFGFSPPDTPGWPDASKPGVPANPERTGPHWIEDRALNHVACVVWCHVMEQFHDMSQTMTPKGAAKFWRYLGPCHTPADLAALVAAGQEAMRERIAQEQMCGCKQAPAVTLALTTPGQGTRAAERLCGRSNCAAMIAAEILETPLPAPEALAAIRAEARREGILEAARVVATQVMLGNDNKPTVASLNQSLFAYHAIMRLLEPERSLAVSVEEVRKLRGIKDSQHG